MPEMKPETLRPLPLRVTQRQYLRLVAHRALDQMSIQEHVRRALDFYLDDLDQKRPGELMPAPPSRDPPVARPSGKSTPAAKRELGLPEDDGQPAAAPAVPTTAPRQAPDKMGKKKSNAGLQYR